MKPLSAPPNWTSGLSALAKFGLLIFIGGAVYSVAQTVVSLLRGSISGAVTTAGLAVFFCAAVATVVLTLTVSGSAADTRWDGVGTTVRVNPSIAWAWGVALLGGAVGSSCYLVFVSYGDTELPFATTGRGGPSRYLLSALLLMSIIGLIALLRTRESGRLRFSVDGVEHADMFRTRSARWEDLIDISDKSEKSARNPIVFSTNDAKPIVVPNADRFGVGGPALYWMARHYWNHPESRDELHDGRALDRLRNEDFEQV